MTCTHYWVIEAPNGAMSWGRCKRCKAKREFCNVYKREMYREDAKRFGTVVHMDGYRRRGAKVGVSNAPTS